MPHGKMRPRNNPLPPTARGSEACLVLVAEHCCTMKGRLAICICFLDVHAKLEQWIGDCHLGPAAPAGRCYLPCLWGRSLPEVKARGFDEHHSSVDNVCILLELPSPQPVLPATSVHLSEGKEAKAHLLSGDLSFAQKTVSSSTLRAATSFSCKSSTRVNGGFNTIQSRAHLHFCKTN